MEAITSAISVQVDTKDKEQANNILKSLGLNMSTFVNMAIKQLIYTDGLPFEVKNPNPNSKLLNALNESEDILSNKINAKKYHNMDELLKDLKD
ncbi:MAG: type II toxin-antitoxin system RelB/DinJ family antitoxin [Tenericutes bacterium]|nr:type II toxin-antitoxin system RelB/DinJ family antitoxin [Mycoplasmatota bacterium]